jgi:hypothetical protein
LIEAKDAHALALAQEFGKVQLLEQKISSLQAQAGEVPILRATISTLENTKASLDIDMVRFQGLEAGTAEWASDGDIFLTTFKNMHSRRRISKPLKLILAQW